MSIGYGGFANKILEDEKTVIYEYGGYNLNVSEFRNEDHICDGSITVSKSCFVEPEIHEKIKKMPSGRKKLVVKRIPVSVDYRKLIVDGLIEVKNCRSCWQTFSGVNNADITAIRILFELFREYQLTGDIPEHISYYT